MGTDKTQRANAADSSRSVGDPQAAPCCRSRWRWYAAGGLLAVVAIIAWLRREAVDPDLERRQGVAFVTLGRMPDAIGCFERALAVRDDSETRRLLADALKTLGRFDDASHESKRALTLDAGNAAAWFNYGKLLRTEFHDKRSALEAFRKASEADPNYGEAQFSLGVMLMETADYETAVAALQSALQVAKPDAAWRADAETALQTARIRALEAQGKLKPPRQ
jgi:tetratricopeptide (TPR) repeat protein